MASSSEGPERSKGAGTGFLFERSLDGINTFLKPLNLKPKKRVESIKDVAFARLERTKKFVNGIDIDLRKKIYKEYNETLEAIAPDLKNMGQVTGNQMLAALMIPMNDKKDKKWREDLGVYPELTQTVVRPILQPFCDGLWEPFDGFIGSFKRETYMYIGIAAVTGLVTGFGLGRCSAGGGGKK
uniref:Uncharacterized protein n=1 Tax=Chloropicon laureae TaxID=464258 RepID=A0A7S2YXC3_9CHLO|mmetsp:Transcript_11739/g.30395  ORF Transcript_11739/g.30395 Transcript_11739/m.30395 type:complete len:184 (+) Transcript_11739:62-613(+)